MLIKIYLLSYNISDWNLRWNEDRDFNIYHTVSEF